MISGTVVLGRGAVIPLVVLDAEGREHAVSAIVDTGFNGWLTLPRRLARVWGVPSREQGTATLADGSAVYFAVYRASVIWDGQPTAVLIDEMESELLIGMRLMLGYRILIEDKDGGAVQIERMWRARNRPFAHNFGVRYDFKKTLGSERHGTIPSMHSRMDRLNCLLSVYRPGES